MFVVVFLVFLVLWVVSPQPMYDKKKFMEEKNKKRYGNMFWFFLVDISWFISTTEWILF